MSAKSTTAPTAEDIEEARAIVLNRTNRKYRVVYATTALVEDIAIALRRRQLRIEHLEQVINGLGDVVAGNVRPIEAVRKAMKQYE